MTPSHAPAQPPRQLRVFISSPGDVADERGLALGVLAGLQAERRFRDRVWIRAVSWDAPGTAVAMEATQTPQLSVDRAVGTPAECDLVAVILWSRLGTPLPQTHCRPDGSVYRSGTEYEYDDAVAAHRESGTPRVLLYRRLDPAPIDPRAPDLDERLEQLRRVREFFDALSDTRGAALGGVNDYGGESAFERAFERHARDFLEELLDGDPPPPHETDAGMADPRHTAWSAPPFPGLHSFTEDDAPIFFGRSAEVSELVAKLRRPGARFLGVTGASGCGKSSLLRAGLVPRLKADSIAGSAGWLYLRPFTPGELGNEPLLPLADRLAPLCAGDDPAKLVAERLAGNPTSVADLLRDAAGAHAAVVFAIDQFEELFADDIQKKSRDDFLAVLAKLVDLGQARVLITVRDDFQHRCLGHPAFGALLRRGELHPLRAPDRGALRDMILGPLRLTGVTLEDGLCETLVEDLCGRWEAPEPGALALLAYALQALWDARDEAAESIPRTAYDALGDEEGDLPGATAGEDETGTARSGVHAAIGRRAELEFRKLPAAAQDAFGAVFRELVQVTPSGTATRRRAQARDVFAAPGARELVEALAGRHARLLVQSGPDAEPRIEVAHEALFHAWGRLRAWIADHADDVRLLRQVETAANAWRADPDAPNPLHRPWPHESLLLVDAALGNLGIRREALDEPLRSFLRPEASRLLDAIADDGTSNDRRQEIGVRLAGIGDSRPGVGVGADGTPDIDWVDIPGGQVVLEGAYDTGRPRVWWKRLWPGAGANSDAGTVRFDVAPFRIARYPVTWAQYRAFLEAEDGFGRASWWTGLEQSQEPGEQLRRLDNHPADNVSWHDAVAFCRWLEHRLGKPPEGQLRLPTEWEWQQAATGGETEREHPWGAWEAGRANTSESGLGRTTAAGLYPGGASAQGVLDLAGNVWEWCLNKRDPASDVSHGGDDTRVVRGGSWHDDRDYARCASRDGDLPAYRYGSIGFRVVLSSPIP